MLVFHCVCIKFCYVSANIVECIRRESSSNKRPRVESTEDPTVSAGAANCKKPADLEVRYIIYSSTTRNSNNCM